VASWSNSLLREEDHDGGGRAADFGQPRSASWMGCLTLFSSPESCLSTITHRSLLQAAIPQRPSFPCATAGALFHWRRPLSTDQSHQHQLGNEDFAEHDANTTTRDLVDDGVYASQVVEPAVPLRAQICASSIKTLAAYRTLQLLLDSDANVLGIFFIMPSKSSLL